MDPAVNETYRMSKIFYPSHPNRIYSWIYPQSFTDNPIKQSCILQTGDTVIISLLVSTLTFYNRDYEIISIKFL